ncbi:hypothetical protein VCSRO4_2852 [Vibrio cholerae]|nr:hypothetical protein VCSRO4_2852 [Vibrio cholerae]
MDKGIVKTNIFKLTKKSNYAPILYMFTVWNFNAFCSKQYIVSGT